MKTASANPLIAVDSAAAAREVSRKSMDAQCTFKIADRPEEYEAIHRLNYRAFVEEIPQHPANPEGRLVDRFHAQNTYVIGIDGSDLVGMLALRTERPFSLDLKLPNLDELLPPGRRIGEVRLLAVDPSRRRSGILPGLFRLLEREALTRGLTMLIVSATTRQSRLYDRLGFVPFGPLVGGQEVRFRPMCLTLERFREVEPTYAWRRDR